MIHKKPKQSVVVGRKGLVICNIGDGKGKTTAAMGSAVRASGAGMNVYILQFVKAQVPKVGEKRQSGEWPLSSEVEFFNNVKVPNNIGSIKCEQTGAGFVGILGDKKQKDQHIREALRGLELARQIIQSGEYQLVILDEILSAVDLNLLSEADIIDLIKTKPELIHIMMTGHKKYPKIFKLCDTVTEMKVVKHAYYEGVLAQKGIDF